MNIYKRFLATESGYMLGVIVGGMCTLVGNVNSVREIIQGLADDESFWSVLKSAHGDIANIAAKAAAGDYTKSPEPIQ